MPTAKVRLITFLPPVYVVRRPNLFLPFVDDHTRAPTAQRFSCYNADDFRCGNGGCVHSSEVCDGYLNCNDGSDEVGCGEKFCQYEIIVMMRARAASFWD